ncbi:MAG: Co2+/Mg2+ efflux protein ApaG [Saprospiraceae bacterium]
MSSIKNHIVVCITQGIQVQAEVVFQPKYSIPYSDQNVFTYHISIHNTNKYPVQLLRRHWWIWESNGTKRQVRGEGVIGKQPVIEPGDTHRYESFCPISSSMGRMWGKYHMLQLDNNQFFEVEIPEFHLMVPEVQN